MATRLLGVRTTCLLSSLRSKRIISAMHAMPVRWRSELARPQAGACSSGLRLYLAVPGWRRLAIRHRKNIQALLEAGSGDVYTIDVTLRSKPSTCEKSRRPALDFPRECARYEPSRCDGAARPVYAVKSLLLPEFASVYRFEADPGGRPIARAITHEVEGHAVVDLRVSGRLCASALLLAKDRLASKQMAKHTRCSVTYRETDRLILSSMSARPPLLAEADECLPMLGWARSMFPFSLYRHGNRRVRPEIGFHFTPYLRVDRGSCAKPAA